jgi:uncharacterized membrane protein (DUF485 family)
LSTTHEPAAGGIPAGVYESAQQTPEFIELRGRYRRFAFPMTAAFLSWYATFVLLSVFAADFMGTLIWGNISIGLVIGLGQFLSTGVITWLYVRHANRKLDPLAEKLCQELEGSL